MALAGYKQSAEHVRRRMTARLATLAAKPRPVSREWLEAQYVAGGRDCVQIGAELGRDPKTVWEWLKFYGIQTRSRGLNHIQLPKDGSQFRGKRHTPETRRLLRERSLADGRVPYLRDGTHWMSRPGTVHPNWKGGLTPERQAFYSTREWRAACVAVWHRADAQCERCGLDHRTIDRAVRQFHVHHIVSFMVRALRAEPTNLALLCDECHRFVHSKNNVRKDFLREPPR